ncbi:hypothetical protein BY458DRAFT_511792 [Sporodiniella umbellata]|nr:hypothetical protein BY458DRAFT_511792 [Sporodiniella umbellata]
MESSYIHSFSAHVLFKQPIVITHLVSMVIAFLGCYPLLLTRQLRKRKTLIICASCVFSAIGFITGCFIQTKQDTASLVLHTIGFILLCLVIIQLAFYSLSTTKWVDLVFGWISLIVAFFYLVTAALVFTDSCDSDIESQCFMPLAMGTGFLIYGSFVLLHLLAVIKLPRPATPEYYESVMITVWGFISLFLFGTPLLGTEWKAINVGLLWFTGGILSIGLSVQTWIPVLRERNIVNCLIICLTGRSIISGLGQADDYTTKVHVMLGYVLMVGSLSRCIQIAFRKSPSENLPRRMLQEHNLIQNEEFDTEDEDIGLDNSKNKKCKHQTVFASTTLISGLLTSILSISAGILFMGSNVGWIRYMRYYIESPSLYINVVLALAFLWASYIFGLCTIYKKLKTRNKTQSQYEYLELNNTSANRMSTLPTTISDTIHNSTAISTLRTSNILNSSPVFSPIDLPQHSPTMAEQEPTHYEKTIRPSEYRAKRRSLLFQNPSNGEQVITRPKSTTSIGSVIPDEVMNNDFNRRSWVSSSGSSYSSGPNSPSFEHKTIRENLKDYMDEERRRSVHKTNSGKRKERQLKQ